MISPAALPALPDFDLVRLGREHRALRDAQNAASDAFEADKSDENAQLVDQACDASHDALRPMVDVRATTMTGVMEKVSAYGLCYGDEFADHLDEEILDTHRNATADRLLYSIVRDIVAIHDGFPDPNARPEPEPTTSLAEEIETYMTAHRAFAQACDVADAGGPAAHDDTSSEALDAAADRLIRWRPSTMDEAADKIAFLWGFHGPFDTGVSGKNEMALLVGSMRGAGR